MATPLTVNGNTYQYPQTGDDNWGDEATNWAVAVTSGMLQKAGGAFTLTAEVDFGSLFGMRSLYYRSRAANAASAGQIRLGNTETIAWRNAANGGDVSISIDSSDKLNFAGQAVSAVEFGYLSGVTSAIQTQLNARVSALASVGAVPNGNAASLSSGTLTLQPADGSNPGVVTAGTQTIGGSKTFSGATVLTGGFGSPVNNNSSSGSFSGLAVNAGFRRFDSASAKTILSIAAPAVSQSQLMAVLNTGGDLTINNEDAGETAANRINTGTGANVVISQDGAALLAYDTSSSRWRMISGQIKTTQAVVASDATSLTNATLTDPASGSITLAPGTYSIQFGAVLGVSWSTAPTASSAYMIVRTAANAQISPTARSVGLPPNGTTATSGRSSFAAGFVYTTTSTVTIKLTAFVDITGGTGVTNREALNPWMTATRI